MTDQYTVRDLLARHGRDVDDVLLSTGEAAARLGVTPRKVLALSKSGKLASFITPGGNHRFSSRAVDALADATVATPSRARQR